MVYVIQQLAGGKTEDVDKMQEKFRQQIYQGCLVLPPNYSLVKIVEQTSANDYTKLIIADTASLPIGGKDRRKFFASRDKHKERKI